MNRQEPQSRASIESPLRKPTYVVIRDVDMPFFAMVRLLVQVSIAAVPAAIILAILWFCVWVVILGGVFGMHH